MVVCECVGGGIESGMGGNGNSYVDVKALKKFADGLWVVRKEKNDFVIKLCMMKMYVESVISFVEVVV